MLSCFNKIQVGLLLTIMGTFCFYPVRGENNIVLKARTTDYNQLKFEETNNELTITTQGFDPYLFFDAEKPVDFKKKYILSFESFNTTESLPLILFIGNLDNNHLIEGYTLPRTEGWTTNSYDISTILEPPTQPFTFVRIRFGTSAGKSFRIRNTVLREPTQKEKLLFVKREQLAIDDAALASRINEYLNNDYQSAIHSVSASFHNNKIEVNGNVVEKNLGYIGLLEIPLWEDATRLKNPPTFIPIKSSNFTIQVNRESEDKHDRILSGWAIAEKMEEGGEARYKLLSHLHYTDDGKIIPRQQLEKKIPRSLKGLGGCPLNHLDMDELGIASVTFNILLDRILYTENRNGFQPYTYAGKTWYVDTEGMLKDIDRDVKIAQQKGWMVSAILLLPINRNNETNTWLAKTVHSEAETSAAFSMPNLLDKEGAESYAATINFLAARYSNEEFGRIHHWIIHNEIQNGFYWTNAGRKKIETFMNLYQKSMRTVQVLARLYDPNATTLISLDHDWNRTGDPRGFKGKEILDLLVKFSKKEGDFEWGIAFHPYPQDINNPRTWEDEKALFSYETPYLTPKNLEVLDSWASRESVQYNGKSREIQFTEQGINSPDYSAKTLNEQAAGMAYSWEKVKRMKNVTAYQYHLWADAHEEAGLKLGLRKYRDDKNDPLGKKPIWHLYKAFDTSDWKKESDRYKTVIGVNDWEDIVYKETIK